LTLAGIELPLQGALKSGGYQIVGGIRIRAAIMDSSERWTGNKAQKPVRGEQTLWLLFL
jgi:hypothetical protein